MVTTLQFQPPTPLSLSNCAMQSGNPKDLETHKSADSAEDSQSNDSHGLHALSRRSSTEPVRKEKAKRPRTTYNIAHPPPGGTMSKISLRPKVLMQLQKLAPNAHAVPAFEVLSAAAFAFKTGRTISSLCAGKSRIRPEDLVVLQGQDYSTNADASVEPKKWSSRHLIGVICRRKGEGKGSSIHTEICLEDGAVWDAGAMPNGGYEFVSQQEHGLTLTTRWVRKHPVKSNDKSATPNANISEQKGEGRTFIFTKITPNMRQHPVVGSMCQTKLDVYDHYNVPRVPSADRAPVSGRPKRPTRQSSSTSLGGLEGVEESTPITTESSLRDLILVSGIWVAFREGWSNTFRYDDERDHGSRPSSPPCKQLHRRTPSNHTLSTSSESGVPHISSNATKGKNGVKEKLIRTGNKLLHHSSASDVLPADNPSQDITARPHPRRSTSTGVAFIQKANRRSTARVKPAINLDAPKSFQAPSIGLGIEESHTVTSPVYYHITPRPELEHQRSFSIDCDTSLESPHENLGNIHVDEHDKSLSQITEETKDVNSLPPNVESSAVEEDVQSGNNFLYKNFKDIFVALKRGSGLA